MAPLVVSSMKAAMNSCDFAVTLVAKPEWEVMALLARRIQERARARRRGLHCDGLRYRVFASAPVHAPRGVPVEIERVERSERTAESDWRSRRLATLSRSKSATRS
jgi:hypothetical protein